jgi:outer membrane protein, heavy metal efflux system
MSMDHSIQRAVVLLAILATAVGGHAEPLTRESAVELALQHNPEIRAAQAHWNAAQARAGASWAPPDPEVGVEFGQLQRLGDPGDFGERSIDLSQTIESPVKWWLNHNAAGYEAESSRAGVFDLTRLDVASRVSVAFDRILSWQQKVAYEVAQDSLLRQFADKARLRHEAGDVPSLEVLRAEVESGRAASRVAWAQNELSSAMAHLAALTGQESLSRWQLRGTLAPDEFHLSLEDVRELGLERRPDLRGAAHDLKSRRARRGAARAGLLPDLNVVVSRQTLREGTTKDDLWRFGVSLEVPIWGALRQRGELAQARAVVSAGEAEVERLRTEVLLQVETAYRDLMTAADQVTLFDERILREAAEAQQAATLSYEAGKATYLDVLDTQRTLLQAQTEYADIVLGYREARVALERAAGGRLEK